jgi:hypothetical protein
MDNVNNALDKILGKLLAEVDAAHERIMSLSTSEELWRFAVMDGEWARIDSCVHWMVERGMISDFNRRMTPEMIRFALQG